MIAVKTFEGELAGNVPVEIIRPSQPMVSLLEDCGGEEVVLPPGISGSTARFVLAYLTSASKALPEDEKDDELADEIGWTIDSEDDKSARTTMRTVHDTLAKIVYAEDKEMRRRILRAKALVSTAECVQSVFRAARELEMHILREAAVMIIADRVTGKFNKEKAKEKSKRMAAEELMVYLSKELVL